MVWSPREVARDVQRGGLRVLSSGSLGVRLSSEHTVPQPPARHRPAAVSCFGLLAFPRLLAGRRELAEMGLVDQPLSSQDGYPFPSGLLDTTVVHEPGKVTVFVRGELDRAAVPVLTACIEDIVGAFVRCPALMVNLAGVDFVDLGGMNLLLDATRWAADRDTTLYLAGCSAQLLRLLRLASILDELEVIPAQSGCSGSPGRGSASTAHTHLPSANSMTPHRVDNAATTCSPRPRTAPRSTGPGCGGGHG
jgi:anti-anti-sigma factor